MTKNNKVDSKVNLLRTTELTGFLPDLTRLGLTEESSTKQLYLSRSHKGLGNAMNQLMDQFHVVHYNDWLGRIFAFYKFNRFRKAQVLGNVNG